ncbi:MAG: CPXCG motif-containing cysteine-rich protein [Gemmatimonas sp.]|nr:CPXCG motif-containing cysteine-rich protein [Gemmatimonas sp.]MCZ8205954.1 CPXCG motif-containing cysteine-rich protein [Gemmatimonas sp.]
MAERIWDDDADFSGELDEEQEEDDLDEAYGDEDAEDDSDEDTDDDDMLDEEFPAGDGAADSSGVVFCPYCGESVEIALDPGGGANQQYIEDCQVCCRPWVVSVSYDDDGTAQVFVDASDDHDEHDD